MSFDLVQNPNQFALAHLSISKCERDISNILDLSVKLSQRNNRNFAFVLKSQSANPKTALEVFFDAAPKDHRNAFFDLTVTGF